MGKNLLVGVGSKARKVKALYVGVGGKARKVKKVYVGVGGKARLVWESVIQCTKIEWTTLSTSVDSSYTGNHGRKTFYVYPVNCTVTPTVKLLRYNSGTVSSGWNPYLEELPNNTWQFNLTRQADDTANKRQVWELEIYKYPEYTSTTVYTKMTCGTVSTPPASASDTKSAPYIHFKDKDK